MIHTMISKVKIIVLVGIFVFLPIGNYMYDASSMQQKTETLIGHGKHILNEAHTLHAKIVKRQEGMPFRILRNIPLIGSRVPEVMDPICPTLTHTVNKGFFLWSSKSEVKAAEDFKRKTEALFRYFIKVAYNWNAFVEALGLNSYTVPLYNLGGTRASVDIYTSDEALNLQLQGEPQGSCKEAMRWGEFLTVVVAMVIGCTVGSILSYLKNRRGWLTNHTDPHAAKSAEKEEKEIPDVESQLSEILREHRKIQSELHRLGNRMSVSFSKNTTLTFDDVKSDANENPLAEMKLQISALGKKCNELVEENRMLLTKFEESKEMNSIAKTVIEALKKEYLSVADRNIELQRELERNDRLLKYKQEEYTSLCRKIAEREAKGSALNRKMEEIAHKEKQSMGERSHCDSSLNNDLNERFNRRAKLKSENVKKANEYQRICEEVRRKAYTSLNKCFAQRIKQLHLSYPSKIEEIVEEEEGEEELPELTPEMNALIDDALSSIAPGQVLIDKFNIQITPRDIHTLAGLNWLNDEVINFYMNLLMERGKNDNYLNVHAFNTFFYPKLMNNGYSSVRRWTMKVDVFKHDLLLVPVHLGMHWCLATINFRSKQIQYYDSMLGDNDRCLETLLKYLESEHQDKKQLSYDTVGWTIANVKKIPQQMNGSDCGMFACKFSEYLSRGAKISFDRQHMPYFRRRMIYEIVSGKLL